MNRGVENIYEAAFLHDGLYCAVDILRKENGGEAMTIFLLIKDMPPTEQEIARKNLLKYCELDTYATVKIWQKLKELCE